MLKAYKITAGAVAALGALVAMFTTPDINLFYSHYFAGLAGGVALMIQLDEED